MQSLRDELSQALEAQETEAVETPPAEPVENLEPVAEQGQRARDEAGRFASAEKKEQVAENPVAPTEEAPAPTPRKAPSSWKPAAQEAFLKADRGEPLTPEEVRLLTQEAERRESDFHKGIEQFKGYGEKAQKYEQAFAPFQSYLQSLNVDGPTAIQYLLTTEQKLRHGDPVTKMQTFQQLARDYGIDLGQVQQLPQPDPQQQYLMQQLNQLRQQQQQWQNQLYQQEQARAQNELGQFATEDKQHFDAVRSDMADLLESGKAKSLQEAYDMAVWMRPDIRQTLLDQQRAEAQKKALEQAQVQKAKAAAVSVKGSGAVSGVQPVEGSLRDMLAAQFDGD